MSPQTLLKDLYWSFAEPMAENSDRMVEALQRYAANIGQDNPASQLRAALPFTDVRVRYEQAVRAASGEWMSMTNEVRIVGLDGRLTGAELMWELHLALHASVGKGDRRFFEGLALETEGGGFVPPVYLALLGS